MSKELSMTQSKAVDKGCLLDLSMPAAECASHPRAIIASPRGEQIGGAVGGRLLPVHSEHRWVFHCPFHMTSLTWPKLGQDLPVPINRVTQQLSTTGGTIATPQGERNCPSAPGAPLCTTAWSPEALTTTPSNTAQRKVLL